MMMLMVRVNGDTKSDIYSDSEADGDGDEGDGVGDGNTVSTWDGPSR